MVREIKTSPGAGVGVFPPGSQIAEELEARGWSQEDLARITGRPLCTINEIIKGKKAITSETALDLAAAFGTSAELWLGLENDYRLSLSQRGRGDVQRRSRIYSLVPVRELQRRGDLIDTNDLDILEGEICALLHLESIDHEPDLEEMGVAARKSDGYASGFTSSQVAWLFLARRKAESIEVPPFREGRFTKEVAELPGLSAKPERWSQVATRLAEWGMRFVCLEHLAGTKIDGAVFWLNKRSPVVALSLRFDRVDHFWFTLMHELGHIHDRSDTVLKAHLDTDLVGPDAAGATDKLPEERKADQLAIEWLLPAAAIKTVWQRRGSELSKASLISLAFQIERHPGIVVGRLQHEGKIDYSRYRNLLVKIRHAVMI